MTAAVRHHVLLTADELAQLAVAGNLCLPAKRFQPEPAEAVTAERNRCAQLLATWLVEETGATEEQALTHPVVAAMLRPGDATIPGWASTSELVTIEPRTDSAQRRL